MKPNEGVLGANFVNTVSDGRTVHGAGMGDVTAHIVTHDPRTGAVKLIPIFPGPGTPVQSVGNLALNGISGGDRPSVHTFNHDIAQYRARGLNAYVMHVSDGVLEAYAPNGTPDIRRVVSDRADPQKLRAHIDGERVQANLVALERDMHGLFNAKIGDGAGGTRRLTPNEIAQRLANMDAVAAGRTGHADNRVVNLHRAEYPHLAATADGNGWTNANEREGKSGPTNKSDAVARGAVMASIEQANLAVHSEGVAGIDGRRSGQIRNPVYMGNPPADKPAGKPAEKTADEPQAKPGPSGTVARPVTVVHGGFAAAGAAMGVHGLMGRKDAIAEAHARGDTVRVVTEGVGIGVDTALIAGGAAHAATMGVLGSKAMQLSMAKPIIQGVAKLGPAGAVIGGGWRATAGAINGDGTEVAKGGLMIPAALGGMAAGFKLGAAASVVVAPLTGPFAPITAAVLTGGGSFIGALAGVFASDAVVDGVKYVGSHVLGVAQSTTADPIQPQTRDAEGQTADNRHSAQARPTSLSDAAAPERKPSYVAYADALPPERIMPAAAMTLQTSDIARPSRTADVAATAATPRPRAGVAPG